MSVSIDRYFGIHAQALALRADRAEVLASNLANADTPNYKARDLDFDAILSRAQQSSSVDLRVNHPGHIAGANGASAAGGMRYRVPLAPALDGNTVDAHVEQGEFAANAVKYQASLHFLNGKVSGLVKALRGE